MSTSFVTSHRPNFRWFPGPGTDGTQVDICGDRDCRLVLETLVSTSESCYAVSRPETRRGVLEASRRACAGSSEDLGTHLGVFGLGWERSQRRPPSERRSSGRRRLQRRGFQRIHVNEIYFYRGGSGGLSTIGTTIHGPAGVTEFGTIVSSAGDVERRWFWGRNHIGWGLPFRSRRRTARITANKVDAD